MFFSGFPGLGQLGLFSIAGIVTALIVTRWVLPHFMPDGFSAQYWRHITAQLAGLGGIRAEIEMAGLAARCIRVAVIVSHRNRLWNDDLGSLSPMPIADKKLDESLRGDIGAPEVGVLLAVKAATEESALPSKNCGGELRPLIEQGVMSGFDAPSLYFPSKASQEARRASLPEASVLRANLDRALQGMPFQNGLFQPFLDEIAAGEIGAAVDARGIGRHRVSTESRWPSGHQAWRDGRAIAAARAQR